MSVRGKKERWCYKVRRGGKKQRVRWMYWGKNREMERKARQLGAPTDTHFCLSSFPLRAGSRRVMAGLHFWQTRELLSHKAAHDSPVTLGSCNKAKAALNLQTKKLTRYRSTAANFHEVVSRGRHRADSSGWGWRAIIGMRENSGVWSYRRKFLT